jgi:hypothetical protein
VEQKGRKEEIYSKEIVNMNNLTKKMDGSTLETSLGIRTFLPDSNPEFSPPNPDPDQTLITKSIFNKLREKKINSSKQKLHYVVKVKIYRFNI